MDSMLIIKHYMSSWSFYFDVISTIPFGDFFEGTTSFKFEFFGLFKLIRVFRISSVIMNLNTSQEIKAALKVMFLVFEMFLYIHGVGCIWNFVSMQQEEWIPNMHFIWFATP